MTPKILLITDGLTPPFDEGFKNITLAFSLHLVSKFGATLVVGSCNDALLGATQIKLGKTFVNISLFKLFIKVKPDLILYLPATSLTLASIARSKIITLLSGGVKTIVFGFQQRLYGKFSKLLIRMMRPPDLVVLSERMRRDVADLANWVGLFTPGVDTERFRPPNTEEKLCLRHKYGIPKEDFILLHVGHIKKTRNLTLLADVASSVNARLLIISSSTFEKEKDHELEAQLIRSGVLIMGGTIEAIEEIYKLADCYAFPVQSSLGATEMPLSVLEAMATNLPILTTPYGSLVDKFPNDCSSGFFYIHDVTTAVDAISKIKKLPEIKSRSMVNNLSLENQINKIMIEICKNNLLYKS